MLTLGTTVLGVDDVARAKAFWMEALGYVPRDEGDVDFVVLVPPDGIGAHLALDVSETPVQEHPRVHLDLYADDQTAEVERLLGLGATDVDWDLYPDRPHDFIVLADTEGNRFCVIDAHFTPPEAGDPSGDSAAGSHQSFGDPLVGDGWQPEGMAAEEFENRDLRGSRFTHVDLSEARIHDALLRDVRVSGAWIKDLVIEGELEGSLLVNGVDLLPMLEAELNARHPGRETVFAVREGDADSFRAAWAVDQAAWAATVERARRLPEEKLHERVDGEWSFIQTLRHLVFATDSWVLRAIQGNPYPYDALDLPFSEMGEIEGVPNDVDARPSLDEVLALRADRMAVVSEVIEHLTDEALAQSTEPVEPIGYPESESFPVRRALGAVVIEEWEHHLFANRDLAVLESR